MHTHAGITSRSHQKLHRNKGTFCVIIFAVKDAALTAKKPKTASNLSGGGGGGGREENKQMEFAMQTVQKLQGL